MIFSVIYSADVCADDDLERLAPPKKQLDADIWTRTESGETEYAYLEGPWIGGEHGKWCALLTRAQFEEFLSETCLSASSTETMGSLGAPGLGIGCSPAISFDIEDPDAISNAYVTPIPTIHTLEAFDEGPSRSFDEHDWERVRDVVISTYQYGI